uniref:Uncharacterized protein n=1 Tax=Anguilla anguilla TaxID=7936 RepID=A0A0E9VM34_ANGAN
MSSLCKCLWLVVCVISVMSSLCNPC